MDIEQARATIQAHPIMIGLLESLPPSGSIWPRAKKEAWLAVARGALEMIYHDSVESYQQAKP